MVQSGNRWFSSTKWLWKMKNFLIVCSCLLSFCTVLVLTMIFLEIQEKAWKPKQTIAIENEEFEIIKENGVFREPMFAVKLYETTHPKKNSKNVSLLGFPLSTKTNVKVLAAFDEKQEAEEWIKKNKKSL